MIFEIEPMGFSTTKGIHMVFFLSAFFGVKDGYGVLPPTPPYFLDVKGNPWGFYFD